MASYYADGDVTRQFEFAALMCPECMNRDSSHSKLEALRAADREREFKEAAGADRLAMIEAGQVEPTQEDLNPFISTSGLRMIEVHEHYAQHLTNNWWYSVREGYQEELEQVKLQALKLWLLAERLKLMERRLAT